MLFKYHLLNRSLEPGDHIAVLKEFNGIKYLHHGILIEFTLVIDFGGTDKQSALVRKIDILKFLKDNIGIVKFEYPVKQCRPAEEVIEFAESLSANPESWQKFCILSNNCEHFATFCKTGKSYCTQFTAIAYECITHPISTAECCCASSACCCSSKKKYKLEFKMEEKV